jgi:YD repeat-containing protein
VEERLFATEIEMRADGSMVRQWQRSPGGSEWTLEKDYDDDGRLRTIRSCDWTSTYQYDDAGRLARVRSGDRVTEHYEYDGAGRKTKTHLIDPPATDVAMFFSVDGADTGLAAPGAVEMRTEYDAGGLPIRAMLLDSDGAALATLDLEYDEAGHLVAEKASRSPESLGPDFSARFSPEQLVAVAEIMGLGGLPVRSYRYDAAGRRVEAREAFGRMSDERTVTSYNEQGDIAESTTESESREYGVDDTGHVSDEPANVKSRSGTTRFRYSYDHGGNWTEKIVESLDQRTGDWILHDVHRREIEYFD